MAVKIITCEKEKDLQNYVNAAGREHFFVCKILYSTPIFNHLKMKCVALFITRSNSFPRIISVTFPFLAIMKYIKLTRISHVNLYFIAIKQNCIEHKLLIELLNIGTKKEDYKKLKYIS